MKLAQVAAQLCTVRDHCKTAPELAVALKKIKAIGYGAVQVSGVGPIPEAEIVAIAKGEGLVICATHEPGKTIVEEPQAVIDRLGRLGCTYTAYPYPHTPLNTLDEVLAVAKALNKAGAKLRRAGMVLTYHNHAIEFRKFGGRTMLEILYAETGKKNLLGEIDTYWVQAGGADPAAWCKKLKRRLPLLHMKDFGVGPDNKSTMMEIGNGNLDWKAIVANADKAGCQWFIVEQDTCPADPFDSLRISYQYIKDNLMEQAAGATA